MIVYEMSMNGELLTRAGSEELSVLNFTASGCGVLGNESVGTYSIKDGYGIDFCLQGLSINKKDVEVTHHPNWRPARDFKLGDEISIRITESDSADQPYTLKTSKSGPPSYDKQEMEKEKWLEARNFYIKHKNNYEQK